VSIPVNSQESAALAALVRARWAGGFATTIYVDGQFAPAHGRERLEVVNPANARTIATIAAGQASALTKSTMNCNPDIQVP